MASAGAVSYGQSAGTWGISGGRDGGPHTQTPPTERRMANSVVVMAFRFRRGCRLNIGRVCVWCCPLWCCWAARPGLRLDSPLDRRHRRYVATILAVGAGGWANFLGTAAVLPETRPKRQTRRGQDRPSRSLAGKAARLPGHQGASLSRYCTGRLIVQVSDFGSGPRRIAAMTTSRVHV